ncbi:MULTISPECIES: hypothetical protein [Nocardioides]|uniref:hypothetical protein n=1 Tax=Nocardioides TaxID=1839 RepID=UPI0003305B41|nr:MULTISPECIES: hypothetical protein [Nocardioides]EON23190.1 hypothetical protein CF8_2967 [Nocardioides sp. CF8]
MTERLTALLRDEAAALDVPSVDHATILGRGRQARTRRRATVFLAAAAVVAVIGTGTALALGGSDGPGDDKATDSIASTESARDVVAYGAGSTVVVDGVSATIPDTLHSLHYTSVGVLTRSNPNDGASDGSGPESLTLVAADGTTTDLGTIPEGVGPATDPDEPVYALAEKSGDGFRVVVRDATTGDEVGSVPLPDLPMSYWPVPPLALDGDVVYAGFEEEAYAVNWRTGEKQPADGLGGGMPQVSGGFAVDSGEKLVDGRPELVVSVVDAATGASALVVPLEEGEYGFGTLSPDGKYLRFTRDGINADGVDIYDVATQQRVTLAGDPYAWGWTSDGRPYRVSGTEVEVCDPVTAACTTEAGPGVGQNLRLGGNAYDS